MENVTIGDLLLFLGIMSLAGLAAMVTVVTNGVKYKPTRQIPPHKR